jgi:hypothetical protein
MSIAGGVLNARIRIHTPQGAAWQTAVCISAVARPMKEGRRSTFSKRIVSIQSRYSREDKSQMEVRAKF